jgi:hypothetical protein
LFNESGSYTLRKRDCSCTALISFASRALQFQFVSRNSMILLARRGLTVLRIDFKVELEAAMED